MMTCYLSSTMAEFGISKCLGRVIDWIMREHNRIIEIYKGFLPHKAK